MRSLRLPLRLRERDMRILRISLTVIRSKNLEFTSILYDCRNYLCSIEN
jgi:hypothetical protein